MKIKKWANKKESKTHQCTKGCMILATTATFSLKSSPSTSLSVKLMTSYENHIDSVKTDALPVDNSERTTLQQVNIPKCNIHVKLIIQSISSRVLMILGKSFWRHLELIVHSEYILPFSVGMWPSLTEEFYKFRS